MRGIIYKPRHTITMDADVRGVGARARCPHPHSLHNAPHRRGVHRRTADPRVGLSQACRGEGGGSSGRAGKGDSSACRVGPRTLSAALSPRPLPVRLWLQRPLLPLQLRLRLLRPLLLCQLLLLLLLFLLLLAVRHRRRVAAAPLVVLKKG
jgi:hypothetical protein